MAKLLSTIYVRLVQQEAAMSCMKSVGSTRGAVQGLTAPVDILHT